MQTQGILLTTLGKENHSTSKSAQPSDRAFGDIMTNLAGKQEARWEANTDIKGKADVSSKMNDFVAGEKLSLSEPVSQELNCETKAPQTMSEEEECMGEAILEAVGTTVKDFLKETFGLSEEELVDLMEQMGIQAMDLLLSFDVKTFSFEGVDVDQLKSLLLEFHGVEDASVILTNPQLEQELSNLTEKIQTVLDAVPNLLTEVIAKPIDENLVSDVKVSKEPVIDVEIIDQGDFTQGSIAVEQKVVLVGQKEAAMDEVSTEEPGQKAAVSVETENKEAKQNMQQDGEAESDLPQKTEQLTVSEASKRTEVHKKDFSVHTFVEKLDNAFRNSLEKVQDIPIPKGNIVEQVINHIRIRVLPETSSIELALNPANLGRVNIAVSVANGVTTATMTVQNQAAKEALESQLIVLKETFAERGLKVESVEVTVSDFGFKNESNGDGNGRGNEAKKSAAKKINLGSLDSLDETEEAFGTEASRVEDSVIDYTA